MSLWKLFKRNKVIFASNTVRQRVRVADIEWEMHFTELGP
jgi:hypothetical protein